MSLVAPIQIENAFFLVQTNERTNIIDVFSVFAICLLCDPFILWLKIALLSVSLCVWARKYFNLLLFSNGTIRHHHYWSYFMLVLIRL